MVDVRSTLAGLADEAGTSLAWLSRALGRNDAYLQQFVKRGTPRRLDEEDRRWLAAYFNVDERALGGIGGSDATMVAVRRIDAEAHAGAGGLVEDDRNGGEERIDPRVVARLGVSPATLTMITAHGDSMEPLIHDGDALFVDMADRRLSSRPGIFVLRLDGALLVKRVARIGLEVQVTSDNPDTPAIAPVRADRVAVIGRVVRLARSLR
ncbi:S24 family peptidase [Sphingomonas pruni]|uniref:S24 family peptidase n=1 Tax=Sphingomonas pruni TaxID=40683 RepID=UPI00082B1057|nr:S24 family peptidase [Sphingomonas pruni]